MPVTIAPRLTTTRRGDIEAALAQTQQERDWYQHHERFPDTAAVLSAVAVGTLVKVEGDDNILPIYRLRQGGDHHTYSPHLLPGSALALAAVGRLWRQQLVRQGIERPEVRLATTSLVRSERRQAELVAGGALAVPESTHCVGAAFDLDASSYYVDGPDGAPRSTPHPGRDQQRLQDIARYLADENPNRQAEPLRIAPESFDERIVDELLVVTGELAEQEYINRLVEFAGTENQCLHIAPNPHIAAEQWQSLG